MEKKPMIKYDGSEDKTSAMCHNQPSLPNPFGYHTFPSCLKKMEMQIPYEDGMFGKSSLSASHQSISPSVPVFQLGAEIQPKATTSDIPSDKHPTTSQNYEVGHQPPSQSVPWIIPTFNKNNGSSVGFNSPPQEQKPNAANMYPQTVLEKLLNDNNYNPEVFELNPFNARFYIVKSYNEDNIHRSVKYSIWSSSNNVNHKLDKAYHECGDIGLIYLFFCVTGTHYFCGMAQMVSPVDFNTTSTVWTGNWKGVFKVKWIFVKDVLNAQLCHIRIKNRGNKPVTESYNGEEVPLDEGKQMLQIMHTYSHRTSLFKDFEYYEKRQEQFERRRAEETAAKKKGPYTF